MNRANSRVDSESPRASRAVYGVDGRLCHVSRTVARGAGEQDLVGTFFSELETGIECSGMLASDR